MTANLIYDRVDTSGKDLVNEVNEMKGVPECEALGLPCNVGHFRHTADVMVTFSTHPGKFDMRAMCWGTVEEILARVPDFIVSIDTLDGDRGS